MLQYASAYKYGQRNLDIDHRKGYDIFTDSRIENMLDEIAPALLKGTTLMPVWHLSVK